ncbi:MAG: T9SS type A sorting domain-containing protein [Balneolaceae bacterium]
MKIKSTIILLCGICFIVIYGTTIALAQTQGIEKHTHKERKGIFFQNQKAPVHLSTAKLKAKADHDISEWLEQFYSEEDWYNSYKSVYEYSTDRLTIMSTSYYFNEAEEWEETGDLTMVFSEEGYPLSFETTYDNSNGWFNEYFYYSENGRLDSVLFEDSYDGDLEQGKIELNYITDDSIRVVSLEDGETFEEGYFLMKDGNFIEVYDDGEYKDRYTYYGVTLNDFLKGLGDDFFFYDYLEEEYNEETQSWIPYGRGTYSEENGRVTEFLEEWYSETEEQFYPDFLKTFQYEGEVITDILEMYNGGSMENPEWMQEYRNLITYGVTVSNVDESEVASAFKLAQNYPNPFNPTTTIAFTVPISGEVQLKIFNIIGAEVAGLINTYTHAGKHSVVFAASALPSGVYFYRLTAPGFSEVKSMTLIK